MEERSEGVILQVRPFKDCDLILTLFTPTFGLLHLYNRGGQSHRNKKSGLAGPLMKGDFLFKKGREDLYFLQEFAVLNAFPQVRRQLDQLEAAATMLRYLSASQLPGKSAPSLYRLLVSYLERLSRIKDPAMVAASFALKILRHDGLFLVPVQCGSCRQPLGTAYFSQGEWLCGSCNGTPSFSFSVEEQQWLAVLCHCTSFSELQAASAPTIFFSKVNQLFEIAAL